METLHSTKQNVLIQQFIAQGNAPLTALASLLLVLLLWMVAEGIIAAVREVGVTVPVVVRLEGTNVEKGKQLLNESGLAIIAADDLNDAAQKAVAAAA